MANMDESSRPAEAREGPSSKVSAERSPEVALRRGLSGVLTGISLGLVISVALLVWRLFGPGVSTPRRLPYIAAPGPAYQTPAIMVPASQAPAWIVDRGQICIRQKEPGSVKICLEPNEDYWYAAVDSESQIAVMNLERDRPDQAFQLLTGLDEEGQAACLGAVLKFLEKMMSLPIDKKASYELIEWPRSIAASSVPAVPPVPAASNLVNAPRSVVRVHLSSENVEPASLMYLKPIHLMDFTCDKFDDELHRIEVSTRLLSDTPAKAGLLVRLHRLKARNFEPDALVPLQEATMVLSRYHAEQESWRPILRASFGDFFKFSTILTFVVGTIQIFGTRVRDQAVDFFVGTLSSFKSKKGRARAKRAPHLEK